jgi:hypothetical protein
VHRLQVQRMPALQLQLAALLCLLVAAAPPPAVQLLILLPALLA